MRTASMLMIVATVFMSLNAALAIDVHWDGGGVDDSWMTPENWGNDQVPGNGDRVFMDVAGDTVLVAAGDTVLPRKIIGPCENAVGTVTMTIEGTLTNTSYWYMGREVGGVGVLNIDGGTVTTRDLNVAPGDDFAAIVNVNAGLLDIYGTVAGTGACFGCDPVAGVKTGSAQINVKGGTLKIALLNPMGPNAVIDMAGGEMILLGDQTTMVTDYKTAQQITAFGGAEDLIITTFEDGGETYTSVVATPEPTSVCLLGLGVLGLLRKKR